MTFSPKVWGDALRRVQDEIPDFAFEAWIKPLAVKFADDRIVLGCKTSFHRDRVRVHYVDLINQCWMAARAAATDGSATQSGGHLDLLTMEEFKATAGKAIETRLPDRITATGSMPAPDGNAVSQQAGTCTAAAVPLPEPVEVGHTDRNTHEATLLGTLVASELRAVPEPKRRRPIAKARSESATLMDTPPHDPGRIRRHDARPPLEGAASQPELPFSFESFVVGPCNALAREAALALARQRQHSLNQLYLGGESGMGKTHLARATAIEAKRHGGASTNGQARDASGNRIIYTSAEQFTTEFVSAMRGGRPEEWKRRYRGPIGLLIVEDVQFFSGRAKTQLELFHTVQHVLDAGGSVLLTGDRTPRELDGLHERMRAQVGRGFVAELDRPDALVRRHILRTKAAAGGVHLPPDCLDLLVESTAGSVRDIESVLIQVVTTSSLLGRTIDVGLTQEAIAMKSGAGSSVAPKTMPVSEIVRLVAAFFGKRPETLASRSRRRDVLVPRQLAMYLAHRYTDASLGEIGRGLGRNHPAVRNAITRVERQVLENAPIRYQVEALSERIDQALKQIQRERGDDGTSLKARSMDGLSERDVNSEGNQAAGASAGATDLAVSSD